MTRFPLLVVWILTALSSTAPEKQVAELSVIIENGAPVITVSNNSPSPITGFVVTVDLTNRGRGPLTRIYYDVYTYYRRDIPIPTGSSAQLFLPHRAGTLEREWPVPTLQAAIFADGTTFGDPRWVGDLLRRRRIVLDRLQAVSARLDEISSRKVARAEALAVLREDRKARLEATRDVEFEDRVLEDMVFINAINNLGGGLRVNGKVPALSVAIEQYKRILNLQRFQLEAAKPTATTYGRPTQHSQPGEQEANESTPSVLQDSDVFARRGFSAGGIRSASWTGRAENPPCLYSDSSEVIEGPTNCGHQYWALKGQVDQTVYHMLNAWSFGACIGGFWNCFDDYEPGCIPGPAVNLHRRARHRQDRIRLGSR